MSERETFRFREVICWPTPVVPPLAEWYREALRAEAEAIGDAPRFTRDELIAAARQAIALAQPEPEADRMCREGYERLMAAQAAQPRRQGASHRQRESWPDLKTKNL